MPARLERPASLSSYPAVFMGSKLQNRHQLLQLAVPAEMRSRANRFAISLVCG